jgi:hypothetical protein
MTWTGHVVKFGGMKNLYKILFHLPERRGQLEEIGIDWMITLEKILEKRGGNL